MSKHTKQPPQVAPKNPTTPLQISTGFLPAVANLVDIVAHQRGTTTSAVLGSAVADLVQSARGDAITRANVVRETQTYTPKLPGVLERDAASPDAAQEARSGPPPQYTERLSGYVTRQILNELDDLCAEAKMSRARMTRLAVDKALFAEIVAAGVENVDNRTEKTTTGV